jgi:hypothetical protein
MLISHKLNFIYLKTHKTAGTSTELLFEPYCRNDNNKPTHITDEYVSDSGIVGIRRPSLGAKYTTEYKWSNHDQPDKIKNILGEDLYNNYYKFCNIRNPFDLMVSLYHWRNNNEINKDKFLLFLNKNKNDIIIKNNKNIWFDPNINIIRFENLTEDIRKISFKLGLNLNNINLKHLKKSNRLNYKSYYNLDSIKIIEEIFNKELNKFNYIY